MLAQRGGSGFLAEWDALARERDPRLFGEALLGMAGRLEHAGQPEFAAEIYAAIVGAVRACPPLRGERPLQITAQNHLDAILGRGAMLPRAEFLLRNFAQQATDPAMLAAMGLAGFAFRMTRLATLSQLAASPAENLLTRGLGARLAAGSVGFFVEAPTFTLAHRGANTLLGREVEWSGSAFGRDLGSGALSLLSLRLMGGLSHYSLGRWANRPGLGSAALRAVVPQTAMYAGLLVSHRAEEGLGLREAHRNGTTYTDALATLFQFHVGGRLAHHVFGNAAAAQERHLEIQTRILDTLNAPRRAAEGSRRGRSSLAWAPALAAMGAGLHTFLVPGRAWAQDHPVLGGMGIVELEILLGAVTVASGALAIGAKRIFDHYWGEPKENAEFFSQNRGRILSGLGGPAPSDALLEGEAALVAQRLAFQHEESLYRELTLGELMTVLTHSGTVNEGAFRGDSRLNARRAGPRVFDVGIDLADKSITRVLELTHPLPQTPLPEKSSETERLFRVGHRIDLQHYADAWQKPVLALPLHPGSEYHLGIPLDHSPNGGYILPTYQRGAPGISAEQLRALGSFEGLLDGHHAERATARPFRIENDGQGYLVMDWQCSRVDPTTRRLLAVAQKEGIRVNDEPLRGNRASLPLENGARIQMGSQDLLWIAPRPGFRMALIRAQAAVPLAEQGSQAMEDGTEGLPPALAARLRQVVSPALLRLPDLVYQPDEATQILLSPRLKGGEPISVGGNPGPGGIFLHGAWNPRARRYEISAQDVEFFLRQDGEDYLIETNHSAPGPEAVVLRRGAEEISLRQGQALRLQSGDWIEFGPLGRRNRLRWYRNIDAGRGR